MSVEFEIHAFDSDDMDDFSPQPMQEDEYKCLLAGNNDIWEWLQRRNDTITMTRDGKTVLVMGIMPLPDSGAQVWLFLADNIDAPSMLLATRSIDAVLEGLDDAYSGHECPKWVQTVVRQDYPQGKRWAKMLGFHPTNQSEDLLGDGTMYEYWVRYI